MEGVFALINFGLHSKRNEINYTPIIGIHFFVDKRLKTVSPKEEVQKVLSAATPDIQDYLSTIALTMDIFIQSLKANVMPWTP